MIYHVGRRSGRTYETPIVAVEHESCISVVLPYGARTDWLHNVLAKGEKEITTDGKSYPVNRPEVIPISEATLYFRPKELLERTSPEGRG